MVRAWLMHVERPGFGWSVSCVSDARHAEAVIAGLERRETRHEGTRLEVELELADGARVIASNRAVRGGRWVDVGEASP